MPSADLDQASLTASGLKGWMAALIFFHSISVFQEGRPYSIAETKEAA